METRSRLCAVVGGGDEDRPAILDAAERLGRLLAEEGWVVMTGGGRGVMEAASRGARQARGLVVGILPGRAANDANEFVEVALATGLGEARNAVIATAADAVIAVGGEMGTLSEVALARKLGKPVLALHSPWSAVPGVVPVASPEEVVRRLASSPGAPE